MLCLSSIQRPEPVKEHVVKSHSEGIAMLAWSPDDTMLLSCGKEDNQEALVYATQVLPQGSYCIHNTQHWYTNMCIETILRVASGR